MNPQERRDVAAGEPPGQVSVGQDQFPPGEVDRRGVADPAFFPENRLVGDDARGEVGQNPNLIRCQPPMPAVQEPPKRVTRCADHGAVAAEFEPVDEEPAGMLGMAGTAGGFVQCVRVRHRALFGGRDNDSPHAEGLHTDQREATDQRHGCQIPSVSVCGIAR